jgi:hypothetical protein
MEKQKLITVTLKINYLDILRSICFCFNFQDIYPYNNAYWPNPLEQDQQMVDHQEHWTYQY